MSVPKLHPAMCTRIISYLVVAFAIIFLVVDFGESQQVNKDLINQNNKRNLSKNGFCIARFETGEPLYYSCPRPNDSEKKVFCCYLDKCCDYKEFQKQQERQYQLSELNKYLHNSKGALGSVLKWILIAILLIIATIVGCCCCLVMACKKKKLFTGGIFSTPLPTQPPGPSPYAPPTQTYNAYQWPPETNAPQPPPAYPSYPTYPSAPGGLQASYPNYK